MQEESEGWETKRTRRQFSSEEKAEAVKRHLVGGEAVSAICEDLGIAPNLFYRWQKELFDHGAAAFEVKGRGKRPDKGTHKLVEQNEKLPGEAGAQGQRDCGDHPGVRGAKKKSWRGLKEAWTEPDVRDEVVDFVRSLHSRTDIAQGRLVRWLGIARSKFYEWKERYGRLQRAQRTGSPRISGCWTGSGTPSSAISSNTRTRLPALAYMMMDADVVAVSPSTVYRTLKQEGLLGQARREAVEEGHGLRAAAPAAPGVAHRRDVRQLERDLLLPMQRVGWIQPLYRAVGDPRGDEGNGRN